MTTEEYDNKIDKLYEQMQTALDTNMPDMNDLNLWHKRYNEICSPFWKEMGGLSRTKRMQMKCVLGDKVPEFGDLMTLQHFIECVECGGFINSDGYGTYVKNGRLTNISILPSDIRYGTIRREFTEIVWYNK